MIFRQKNIEPVFDNIEENIIKELDKAAISITVAVAWFTSTTLMAKLIEKASAGLQVDLIRSEEEESYYELLPHWYQKLQDVGGDSYTIPRRRMAMMHNKFCVIDQSVVITGSYNWTNNAERSSENVVIIRSQDVANLYTQNFIQLLDRAQTYPSDNDFPSIWIDLDKYYVNPGEEFEFYWSIKNSDYQILSGGEEIKKKGSLKEKINYDKTFTIIASKDGLTKTKSLKISVYRKPKISYHLRSKNIVSKKIEKLKSISGRKFHVHEGQEVYLHWKIEDADKIIIDNKIINGMSGSIGLNTGSSKSVTIRAYNREVVSEEVFSLIVTPLPKFEKVKIPLHSNVKVEAAFEFVDVTIPSSPIIKELNIPRRIKIPSISKLKATHIPVRIETEPKIIEANPEFEVPNSRRRLIVGMKKIWRRNIKLNKKLFQSLKDIFNPNEK